MHVVKAAEIPVGTFYFTAKKRLLDMLMTGKGTVLDIGCGSGQYSNHLAEAGFNVTGADIEKQEKTGKAAFIVLDLEKQKLPKKFDYILAMDVLEHIADDSSALSNASEMLSDKGKLVLVVPALPFLYGAHDINCGHKRRYSKSELIKKLKSAGLKCDRIFYWNFPAVFSAAISKMLGVSQPYRQASRSSLFSRLVLAELKLEEKLSPPIGLDLVCIASKA